MQNVGSGDTNALESMGAGGGRGAAAAPAWQNSCLPKGVSMFATPFSAMAALLDDCMLRAGQSGPTCASWDVRSEPAGAPPQLVFEHDSNGMSPEDLAAALGLDPRLPDSPHANAGAGKMSALMHAVLRLGGTTTVLTKRLSAGKVLPSVGLGVIVIDSSPGLRALTGAVYCNPDQSLQEGAGGALLVQYQRAFLAAGYTSWEELQVELDTMPPQGTKILIRGLWARSEGGPELDLLSDPTDIRCHRNDALADLLPAEKKDTGVQRCTVHRYSLRAYASILYRRWPAGFGISIRGMPVQLHDIRAWMRGCVSEEYRPRGVKDEVDEHGFQMQHVVHVHVGFLVDVPNTSMQGFCLYHKNRLVKPFWRVYSSSTVGRGVVGYLEADFVQPTPDWQDFERSHAFLKLEAFLKRCVPAYWKKHAAAVGYLAGPAGPPTALRMQQQQQQQHQHRQQQQQQLGRMLPGGTPFALPGNLLPGPVGGLPGGLPAAAAAAAAHMARQRSGNGGGLPSVLTHPQPGSGSAAPDPLGGWGDSGSVALSWGSDSLTPHSAGGRGVASGGMPSMLHASMAAASQGMAGQLGTQSGFLGQQPGALVGGGGAGFGHGHGMVSAGAGGLGANHFSRQMMGGGSGPAAPGSLGLPPAMHAMLQSFSAGAPGGSLGGSAGAGASLEPPPPSSSAGPDAAPPIHQLQRLLAAAPAQVVQQLQGSDAPFLPQAQQQQQHHQQVAGHQQGQEQQAAGGWDTLLFGQDTAGSVDLAWLGREQAQAQQPAASKPLATADLAQALCTLVNQPPGQLAQVAALLNQQAQQAEHAGLPSSTSLHRVQSLLCKLTPGGNGSPHSQSGAAPELPPASHAVPVRPAVVNGSKGIAPAGPATQARLAGEEAEPSSGHEPASSAAAGPAQAGRPAPESSDRGCGLESLLAAAAAAPAGGGQTVGDERATTASPPTPAAQTAAAEAAGLEQDIAAFVREAVPDVQRQQEGLELAKRVRATVERLAQPPRGPADRDLSQAEASPTGAAAKRQRV